MNVSHGLALVAECVVSRDVLMRNLTAQIEIQNSWVSCVSSRKCLGLKWHFNHCVKHLMIGVSSNQNLLRFQDENSLTGPGGDVTMTFQAFTTRQSDTYSVWAGLSEKLSAVS